VEDDTILPYVVSLEAKKKNYRNFEYHEWTLVEFKAFFFKALYRWAAAFVFNTSSFQVFLYLFSSSS
jgi:hypothetical protein